MPRINQTMLRRTLLAAALATGVSATPALSQGNTPAAGTVVDAIGRTVTLPAQVERVVINFNYEEFTAIAGVDGWARVVGISRAPWEGWRPAIFSRYAQVIPNLQGMPDVGHTDDNSFSAEKVIALRPSVVILAEWAWQTLTTQRAQIEAAGIPIVVIDYNAQTLERHLASTRAIGRVMGTEARAEELAGLYEREYRDVLARVARVTGPKPSVYVELGQAGPATIGNTYNNTMWGKIITTLGANNIAEGRIPGPWGPLNAETVIASNPDMILIAGSSWVNRPLAVRTGYDMDDAGTRRTLRPYAERPGWAGLKAVRSGNVIALEHGLARTLFDFAVMQFIAKRLYPAQFADVDPVANLAKFHQRYLPVPFTGTWMVALQP